MNVEGILKTKGAGVVTIEEGKQIHEIARVLHEKRIGAAVVVDSADNVCGVLSERDVVRAIAKEGPAALHQSVSSFMTADVITCGLHDTIDQLMNLMTDRRIRHLPVLEEGKLVGIISIGDVVKWRIAETVMEAEALRDYIATG